MADEDPTYTNWIRTQPCAWCFGPGPSHAHHSTSNTTPGGRRGKGEKAHDHDSIPLHLRCHAQFHELTGPFKGWEKARIRSWQDDQVAVHRQRYAAQFGELPWAESAAPTTKVLPRLLAVSVCVDDDEPDPSIERARNRPRSVPVCSPRELCIAPVLVVFCDARGNNLHMTEPIEAPLNASQILAILDQLGSLSKVRT